MYYDMICWCAAIAGCWLAGCGLDAGGERPAAEPSRRPARIGLEALNRMPLSTDQLIDLLSGCQVECEGVLLGRPDVRGHAARVLERRMEAEGPGVLSESRRERLTRCLRSALPDCRDDIDSAILDLAAKHDPDFTAKFFLEHWDMLKSYPDPAFRAIRTAGLLEDARRVLERRMQSWDESEVCLAIYLAAKNKVEGAADAIYARTSAMRWLIRLEALQALDRLDDPRTNQALRAHFRDIERTSIGLRVLAGPRATLIALMGQSGLRDELVKALVRRKVEGADGFLEKLALDPRQGQTPVRWLAGVGLAMLDRPRGTLVLRRLLQSRDEDAQRTGIEIARSGLALDAKQELQKLAQESPFETVKEDAAQVLYGLGEGRERQEPYF